MSCPTERSRRHNAFRRLKLFATTANPLKSRPQSPLAWERHTGTLLPGKSIHFPGKSIRRPWITANVERVVSFPSARPAHEKGPPCREQGEPQTVPAEVAASPVTSGKTPVPASGSNRRARRPGSDATMSPWRRCAQHFPDEIFQQGRSRHGSQTLRDQASLHIDVCGDRADGALCRPCLAHARMDGLVSLEAAAHTITTLAPLPRDRQRLIFDVGSPLAVCWRIHTPPENFIAPFVQ